MDAEDTSWAPQSPDLTAASVPDQFEPHPQHREYRGSVSYSPFTPTSEVKTPFGFPPPHLPAAAGSLPHYEIQPGTQPQQHSPVYYHQQSQVAPSPAFYHQQPQSHNPYFAGAPVPPPHGVAQFGASQQPNPLQHYQYPPHLKQEDSYGSEDTPAAMAPARGGKKAKREDDSEVENNAPGVREGIEVRTKFPVARIKRIMQADEDVGKVAQVTPVAVSKALELFMISLVTKAAAQARERGSKRVLAAHLKQAVLDDDQFDYLQDIVSKVAEAPSKNADKQEDSDEAMEGGAPAKRKRAAGGGRKKRKDSDEF